MNFLAATLLIVLNHDEEEAFWIFTRILEGAGRLGSGVGA